MNGQCWEAGSEPGAVSIGGRRLALEKPFREHRLLTQGKMGGGDCLGHSAHVLVFNVGQCRE